MENTIISPREEENKDTSLKLKNEEGISQITKKDGISYSVRQDRRRYFFPNEWELFIKSIRKPKHYILFLTLLHTGARIMEALHLKPKNFDFDRGSVTFDVVKQRKAKKQYSAIGKSRSFFVSKSYLKEVKRFIERHRIAPEQYLFLNNDKLPPNYEQLSNKEKKRFYAGIKSSYGTLLKRKLRKIGIPDWKQFSLHNIRKTYGNWMRIYDIKIEELCYRLGHDIATFMSNYGSSLIFTQKERQDIMRIMGEVRI